MIRKIVVSLVVVAGLGGFLMTATRSDDPPAAAPVPDDVVQKALDAKQIPYKVDSQNHNCEITWRFDDRTQKCTVASKPNMANQVRVREVVSLSYVSDTAPTAEVANALLIDTAKRAIGFWALVKRQDGKFAVLYCAEIAADADADTIAHTSELVAAIADLKEKEMTAGADKF